MRPETINEAVALTIELETYLHLHQLAPQQLCFGVMQRCPETINEAVALTIELETYLQLSGTFAKSPESDNDRMGPLQAVSSVQAEFSKTLQTLSQRVEEIEHLISPNLSNRYM